MSLRNRSRCRRHVRPGPECDGLARRRAEARIGASGAQRWRMKTRAAPRRLAALGESVEPLLVLDRIHRLPEALVPKGDELSHLDQPRERLNNQLFPWVDVV